MTMKKIMKIVAALLLAVTLVMTLSPTILADTANIDITQFDDKEDQSGAKNSVTKIIGTILDVARVVATGFAVIMLVVLAIQYISASPEGKAEIKKTATIYVVGAVILFAASGILTIIKKFALTTINDERNS